MKSPSNVKQIRPDTKYYPGCCLTLPVEKFSLNKAQPSGFNAHCRDCRGANRRAKGVEIREEKRRWIIEYLLTHPCVICGEMDIVVLEFDHIGNKYGNVAT